MRVMAALLLLSIFGAAWTWASTSTGDYGQGNGHLGYAGHASGFSLYAGERVVGGSGQTRSSVSPPTTGSSWAPDSKRCAARNASPVTVKSHDILAGTVFIAFEGIDGSGKSTAMAAIATRLAEAGVPHWTTREETDRFGAAIRRSIRDGRDPLVTTYLFLADRAVHVSKIRRHLDDGEVVLSDRFMHSTLAYQGVTLAGRMDDPVAWLRGLHDPMGLVPDLVLWLDVPADVAVKRVAGRGATAPYEKQRFLEQVATQYAELADAEPDRFVRIDAAGTAQDVADAAWHAVQDALPPWQRQAAAEV